jgi:ribosomal-protein-alanine N-acetyltransferase
VRTDYGTIRLVTDQLPAPTELRTSRLLLRPPRLEDADAYFDIASDPEYAFYGSRGSLDREATARGLARIIAKPWPERPEFAIALEGRVIGRIMLDVDRANLICSLGYGIARDSWGHGFATEAARAVVDYAFEGLGMDKVWARADPRNVASVRVLEKLGMQREGLFRGHVLIRGQRLDRVYYGLLREEWTAGRAAGG